MNFSVVSFGIGEFTLVPELIGMEEQLPRRAGQLQSSWGGSCQGYESNKTGGRPSLCHSLGNVALIQPIWMEVENYESTLRS